ncbi:MAG: O-phosphoserine--tRNA ligase [Promethearchaeota archaeon]
MKWPINKIITMAKEDYEKEWLETAALFKNQGRIFNLQKNKGKSHPVKDFMSSIRTPMIELGFEEIILPMMVDESDVYKEYGPEAALILDRLFYLSELPRPDIGISKKKINIIKKFIPKFDDTSVDKLKSIFRRYKKGDIEADDLIEVMVNELLIKENEGTAIIERAFPEFKELKPIPSKKTLRSHTTALWFPVLAELYKKKPLPLQYFLVGPKWRREQKIDEIHLICSNTLSIAILAEEITLEDSREIGRQIAKKIGFKKIKIETKTATSKYYAPQTEFEIFVQHPKTKEWLEIGDGGFYSPVSLANYQIDRPVLNIGFGVERIVMIKTGETDIRNLVYPYFYSDIHFTDKEIAKLLCYENVPKTIIGKNIAEQFIKTASKHAEDKSPVEIEIFKGEINDKSVKITIWENENNVKLLGKAARNIVWIKDGSIICKSYNSSETGGVKTNFSFLGGIANMVASKAEELSIQRESPNWSKRIRMVRRPSELNISINEKVKYFIHSTKKRIDINGPVFIGINIEIE